MSSFCNKRSYTCQDKYSCSKDEAGRQKSVKLASLVLFTVLCHLRVADAQSQPVEHVARLLVYNELGELCFHKVP